MKKAGVLRFLKMKEIEFTELRVSFADDMVIVGNTEEGLEYNQRALTEALTKVNMFRIEKQTKIIIW